MRDVGQRVIELAVGQRAAAPIGEAQRFVDAGAGQLAGQGLVGHRIAEAAHHRRHLAIEQRRRHLARKMQEDFHILAGGMKDFQHLRIVHQLEERGQIHARRHGVDRPGFLGSGQLDQAQLRPVGFFPHEFGIDGNEFG